MRVISRGMRGEKRLILIAAITSIAASARGQGNCSPDSDKALRRRLPALIDSAGIPGIALAFIERGRVKWAGGFGDSGGAGHRVEPNTTVFEAASLSKPVIAYAALRLVDQGKLDLDRSLLDYTPYPDFHGDPRGALITARMVLAHTTGLQNERIGSDSLRFSFSPGARFQYSGEGYVFLGRAIEAVTRTTLPNAMKMLVFDPLGMKRSSFVWQRSFARDAAIGHGRFGEPRVPTRPVVARAPSSLHTTVADYARFIVAVTHGTGLSAKLSRAMRAPVVSVATNVGWGLGWAIEENPAGVVLAHHGDNSNSGFTAFALVDPQRRCGLVYFANSANGLSIVREVASVIPGAHPGVDLLPYERYAAPAALARRQLAQALRAKGVDSVIVLYRSMKAASADKPPETLLNDLGYSLLNQRRIRESVAVFEENARQFPQSANVYDSLGDAYLAARNREGARNAYHHAALLDPNNIRARRLADSLGAH
ncbi:MAG: serine hydrolase [Gemmatimonadaceae bacterium]